MMKLVATDLLQNIPLGLVALQLTEEGYIPLFASSITTERFGKTAEQMAALFNTGLAGFVYPEDEERVKLMLYKAGVTGGQFSEVVRLRLVDGTYSWTDLRIAAQTAGSAKVLYLSFINIDKQIASERKLEKSYDKLLGVMDNVPGGIMVFGTTNNRDPFLTFASAGIYRLLEGSRENFMTSFGRDFFAQVHPEDQDNVMRIMGDSIRTLAKFRLTFRLRNLQEKYILVDASGMVEAMESQRNVYVSLTNASEGKEAQQLLQHIMDMFVRKQYQTICLVDGQKNSIRALSKSVTSHQVFPAEQADYNATITKLAEQYLTSADRKRILQILLLPHLRKTLAKQSDIELYTSTRQADGSLRYKRIWIGWIDKAASLLALVLSDDTEARLKQLEQQKTLVEALQASEQASVAKSIFLSRMSHDIRTPLNAIIGFTEMTLEDTTLAVSAKDYLHKIEDSSRYLLSLINDVLDMSRIESGKYSLQVQPFALQALLTKVNTIIASQCELKGLHYGYTVEPGVKKHYAGDSLKLQQVLVNILGNSVKFTPAGGQVSLLVREKAAYDNFVILNFVIRDTGIGMSKEFLPHLFESFCREDNTDSKSSGTGLGLSICKNIVALMHGKIEVQSEKNKGSEFSVEVQLDLTAELDTMSAVSLAAAGVKKRQYEFGGLRILLAEDQPLNQEIAKHLLEKVGFKVDVADNGKLACDKFAAAPEDYYSAVILDIRMPVMDGLKAASTIRSMKRPDVEKLPLIAMSADAFEEDISKSLSHGINAHLIKPIDSARLYATLAEYLLPS